MVWKTVLGSLMTLVRIRCLYFDSMVLRRFGRLRTTTRHRLLPNLGPSSPSSPGPRRSVAFTTFVVLGPTIERPPPVSYFRLPPKPTSEVHPLPVKVTTPSHRFCSLGVVGPLGSRYLCQGVVKSEGKGSYDSSGRGVEPFFSPEVDLDGTTFERDRTGLHSRSSGFRRGE